MANIYKITNIVNGCSYIGKTSFDLSKRWKWHLNDATKGRCKNRSFYKAINEFGAANFTIELIEECDNEIAESREKYWINYFGTFTNGYNETMGGAGKNYIEPSMVIKTYEQLQNKKETAKRLGICVDTVDAILRRAGVKIVSHEEMTQKRSRPVMALNEDDVCVHTFKSICDAARWISKRNEPEHLIQNNISDVCRGRIIKGSKRKTAYGYKWKYC